MNSISRNKYGRMFMDVFVFGIGMVLAKLVQFLLMPLYTSYMSVESYGNAELINNLSDLFLPIVTLCIYKACSRYTVKSEFDKKEVISTSLKIITISAIMAAFIFFCVDIIFQYDYVWYLYVILYSYSLKMIFSFYVRGKGYSKLFASSGIINALALAIYTILFLVYFKLEEEGYLLAICMSHITTVCYLFFFGAIYKDITLIKNNRACLQSLLSFGTPLILYNIGYWFTTMSGRYILLWFTDASTAGLYVAAIKISAVINMMQQATQASFELNASKEYGNSGNEHYYSNLCNLFSTIFYIVGAFIIALTPFIASFTLRKEFINAEVYLPIIMMGAIIQCLSALYGTMYDVYKCTKKTIPYSIIGTIVNVGGSVILVPIYGIWGVCIASLLCYLVQFVYKIIDINSFCKLNVRWKTLILNIFLISIETVLMTKGKQYYVGIIIVVILIVVTNLIVNYMWLKVIVEMFHGSINKFLENRKKSSK